LVAPEFLTRTQATRFSALLGRPEGRPLRTPEGRPLRTLEGRPLRTD